MYVLSPIATRCWVGTPENGGATWTELRVCLVCGHVGCCDSSPSQHASRHAREEGHPWVRSYEPGEDWYYNFESGQMYEGPPLAPPLHHPLDQPVPVQVAHRDQAGASLLGRRQ